MKAKLALVAMFVCFGCVSSPADDVPLTVSEMGAPDNTSLVQSGDLRVSPLDMLEIKVFGSDELSGAYQVDPGGEIKFPMLGALQVKGYTTFELASLLEAKLKEKYLQNPLVNVRVSESNGQQFTIEGSIGRPGMYPVKGPMTLIQALAVSGGPTSNANLGAVLIFRTVEGERKVARFDLRMIRAGKSVDPVVYGNDVIVVDGRDQSYDEMLRNLPLMGVFRGLF